MNYFRLLLLSALLGYGIHPVTAQTQQPMFQTTFYVEDALGNQDSVVIGFDPSAGYLYNPQFGELHITAPMDTLLEVRACHRDGLGWAPDYVSSKKIIGGSELVAQWGCYVAEQIHIFVKAKHQPVTFRWNPQDWSDFAPCQQFSFMTPDNLVRLIDVIHWFEMGDRRGTCLSDTNQYTLTLTGSAGAPNEFTINLDPAISGEPDSVFGVLLFWFGIDHPLDFCNQSVSAPEAGSYPLDWKIFPNPTNHTDISIQFGDAELPERVMLRNALGNIVATKDNVQHTAQLQIGIAGLSPGIYTLECWQKEAIVGVKKIVVAR